MYSAVHIYTNLPVAVKVVDRRKVKSWDVLHGHSVPREFKLLYALQGRQMKHPVYLKKKSISCIEGNENFGMKIFFFRC